MAGCISERRSNQARTGRTAIGILALVSGVCSAAPPPSQADGVPIKVTEVRFWSVGDVTRVAIEVSDEFKYRHDRLSNPDRLFFDIEGARPAKDEKKIHVIPVGDSLLKQIRVAETQPGVTRVVLDLEEHTPPVQYTSSQLSSPARLMIELRLKDNPAPPLTSSVSGAKSLVETPARPVNADLVAEPADVEARDGGTRVVETSAAHPAPRKFQPPPLRPVAVKTETALKPEIPDPPVLAALTNPAPLGAGTVRTNVLRTLDNAPKPAETTPRRLGPEPLPAKRNTNGDESLTRVLGLKLGRVVIDPGHGGHDVGTHGRSGLLEKDVVLDVAKRLGALLQDRLGTEVIYTRDDDTYIPLEKRTEIANDHKADLFLSIHANSSPYRNVAGIETYYLNFTTSKSAMEVAARENAGSERSIFDLQDVIQKIAMKDKIDESREFAARIQSSLYAVSAKSNATAQNRGVKKAPFVVLIGASMPSVLAEIGFLTNARDEALLRKPEQRQKIAEALYKGIAAYADTLSHFQVAKRD